MTKTQLQQWAQELQYGLEACRNEQQGLRHALDRAFKLIEDLAEAGSFDTQTIYEGLRELHRVRKDVDQHAKINATLRGDVNELIRKSSNEAARFSYGENHIDLLEAKLRQLKCQVETKHRNMVYVTRRAYVDSVAARPSYHYVFRCAGCGMEVEKTDSQLTDKDREALIALGLLEV